MVIWHHRCWCFPLRPRPDASQATHTQFHGSCSSSTHWRWHYTHKVSQKMDKQPRYKVLTHWVSQPACLHLRTPPNEPSRTNPHKHPFSASASWRGTRLRFDRPDSLGISGSVATGMWFISLDDVVSTPVLAFAVFTLVSPLLSAVSLLFSLPLSVVRLFC